MILENLSPTWPVIVIGAGPAGSSAAITIARRGLQVLLVDAKAFPRRKVCGGCLNQVSAKLLKQLLAPTSSIRESAILQSAIQLRSFEMTHRNRCVRFPMPEGLAVDRLEMDQALVDAAQADGVTFLAPATAKVGALSEDRRTVRIEAAGQSRELSANVVILACGLGNRTAIEKSALGLSTLQQTSKASSRVGVEAIVQQPESSYVSGSIHMVVGRDGYVGLTRIAQQRLHVAAAVDRAALQQLGPQKLVEAILRDAGAPELRNADAAQWRGTPPLTARAERLAVERVFLVGDAAGYVEPFTGEGIRWALESGVAVGPFAADACTSWDDSMINAWEDWYQNVIAFEQRLCRQITSGLKRPALRLIAHYALRIHPRLASSVIARLNSESNS